MNPVTPIPRLVCTLAVLAGVSVTPAPAQRWQVKYFYDENKSVFHIVDMQFPSATRGVAVGYIQEGRSQKKISVVTADGGEHWDQVELKEMPLSLFFLSENLGWMVTNKDLWQTTEVGKSWRKVPGLPSDVVRVYFTDEQNGYAVGTKKKVFETHDAGAHWTPLDAAAKPAGQKEFSVYSWVVFATAKLGMITGWNQPPRRIAAPFPDWMDPEDAVSRREFPHLSYSLVTNDGGKTWVHHASSLFGVISRVRLNDNGSGLGLIQYSNSFRVPSEVYKIDWKTGTSMTIHRDRGFAVTDIWLAKDGTAYLAGTKVTGQLRNVIPGKVQVLRSSDYIRWYEMPVDYRASANSVELACADDQHMWLATDNGMILKLVP